MNDYNFYNNDFQNNQTEPNPVYQPPKGEKSKARFSLLTVIVAAIVAGAVGVASATITTAYFWNQDENQTNDHLDLENNTVNINVEEQALSVVEAVAKKVTPCVVGIRTTTSVNSFFGNQQEESGEGSGVIYKQNGYIITNYHVIEDAVTNARNTKIEVFLDSSAENSYIATVVGYNISADLAVIKINVTGLPVVEIADSDKVKVGQYVITVGNPGGLEFMDSVTYGVISGLDRVVSSDSDIGLIQTDAAINPGNSGGALVDATGKLVGINSSKIVSEEFEGMGFAIPSNEAVEICEKFLDKKQEVFLHLMNVKDLSEKDFQFLEKWDRKSEIVSLYFADSYGSFFNNDVEYFYKKLKECGYEKISFHAHNNLQMAFSNSLKAIELGAYSVDATFLGKGRGGGNLPIEMMLAYLHREKIKQIYNDYSGLMDESSLKIFKNIVGGIENIHPKNIETFLTR